MSFYRQTTIFLCSLCVSVLLNAQHTALIKARLNDRTKTLQIKHKLTFENQSNDSLSEVFFMDWANAFSSKTTPLAIRFNEDFRRAFHFSSSQDRGFTTIQSIEANNNNLNWFRPKGHPDILGVKLDKDLAPGQKITFNIKYSVKIPSNRYTRFGFSKKGYKIKFWHLTPAIYHKGWEIYSHKNLNDFISQFSNYDVELSIPKQYEVESNLSTILLDNYSSEKTILLKGKQVSNIKLYLEAKNSFYHTKVGEKIISSDIPREGMSNAEITKITEKVYAFVTTYFGALPQDKVLLLYKEYLKQPVYGFNQLPKKIRPFNKEFQYEIILLKQLLYEMKKSVFVSDLRHEQWLTDGLQIYLMIKYIETYYPEEKLAGKLSKLFGVRWFHAAKINFNDQYYIGYKNTAARFLEQPIGAPKDSLIKFNYNISNPYRAGMGLHYLESYLEGEELKNKIIEFIRENRLKTVSAAEFNSKLKEKASKDLNWYTNNFVYHDTITDVKIKRITKTKDSVFIHLKNKGNPVPIKVTALDKKKVVTSQWTPVFSDTATVGFSRKQTNHFVVDYEERLPEANRRNNYYKSTGLLRKRFQFRLFQDLEYPKYTQIYTLPVYSFNVYDGLILGARFLNKSLTPRKFNLNVIPSYGLKSQEVQGSFSLSYVHQLRKYGWSFLRYGISGSQSSFAEGLTFTRYTPTIRLGYRPKDYRKNLSQSISARFVSIQRERSPTFVTETPNYNVFNVRYNYSDNNLTHVLGVNLDYQLAGDFSRASATFNYRKLFNNNRQINFRTFAGVFINNDTQEDGNFFSFALDRPSDYLFDLGYFARDDNSGLASQQFITTEGNFKTIFTDRFANEWITTASLETNIWNWIFVYGNFGLTKNTGSSAQSFYDSGIRLNLVQDYFELYFPIQSTLGFEPSFNDYGSRIRFKASLSFQTIIRLFNREWY